MKTLEESGLDPRALARGVDYLIERHTQKFIANADWAQIAANGTPTRYDNHACHGQMNGSGVLVATISNWSTYRYSSYSDSYAKAPYQKVLATAIGERFYDWFCTRSWAADYIVAPDLGFAAYSGIMFSTDIPANYALAIVTMSRNCQEQAHIVQRMYDYVDEFEISEDLAYFLAFSIGTENKYGKIVNGHNLFMNHGAKGLDFWMRRDFQKTNAPLRSGATTIGVNDMFGKGERDLTASFDRFKAKVEAGKIVIPNPFIPVVKTSSTMTEEFLRSIIPNLKKEYPQLQAERLAA